MEFEEYSAYGGPIGASPWAWTLDDGIWRRENCGINWKQRQRERWLCWPQQRRGSEPSCLSPVDPWTSSTQRDPNPLLQTNWFSGSESDLPEPSSATLIWKPSCSTKRLYSTSLGGKFNSSMCGFKPTYVVPLSLWHVYNTIYYYFVYHCT